MPGSKSKTLSALVRSATKLSKQWKPVSASTSAQDIALKHYVSPNDSSKSLSEIAAETSDFSSAADYGNHIFHFLFA